MNDVKEKEDPVFVENRHDQSILSLLHKKYGCITLKYESYDDDYSSHHRPEHPFWATRKKSK